MRVLKLILIYLGVDEEGQDADEMNFFVMDRFEKINPELNNSYFQVKINDKYKFIHKQTVCWLLIDKGSHFRDQK